jgi:hypothetical protein
VSTQARSPAQDSVDAVGQILSNYQAALYLFEEAVASGHEVLPRDVLEPVRDACAGVLPGLEELVAETMGATDAAATERQRVAASHSRLLRRRPALLQAAEERAAIDAAYRSALETAAARLAELEAGSHTAGALFSALVERQ